jgi:hypothetical protein
MAKDAPGTLPHACGARTARWDAPLRAGTHARARCVQRTDLVCCVNWHAVFQRAVHVLHGVVARRLEGGGVGALGHAGARGAAAGGGVAAHGGAAAQGAL